MERNYWSHRWAREGKYNRATRTQEFPDAKMVTDGKRVFAVLPSGDVYEAYVNGWRRIKTEVELKQAEVA